MALLNQQLQSFFLTRSIGSTCLKSNRAIKSPCCSAIAIDSPSSSSDTAGIRWGVSKFQGNREAMEDDVVVRSSGANGFSFAAVFDGHAGFSSVKFLRDELYKECLTALQDGLMLLGKDFMAVEKALQGAFEQADAKLINWLETLGEDESGSTATVIFIGRDVLLVSHVGDSSVVLSRSGKAEILTNPHRPYGSSTTSLQEIRRIREAGGWINNGRICGDISVSRAFGDMRFKNKKNKMLEKGIEEGRWSHKFASRVQFKDDLVIASPDIFRVSLGPDVEFLILASDGLWDYINSSDAVNFVRNKLREHGDVQLACEALAQAALDRRSQDNVSIVIADLGRTDWQNLPLPQQNVIFELGQAFATVGIVSVGIWMSYQLSF